MMRRYGFTCEYNSCCCIALFTNEVSAPEKAMCFSTNPIAASVHSAQLVLWTRTLWTLWTRMLFCCGCSHVLAHVAGILSYRWERSLGAQRNHANLAADSVARWSFSAVASVASVMPSRFSDLLMHTPPQAQASSLKASCVL